MTIVRLGDHPLMSDVTVFNGIAYLSGQVALDCPQGSFEEQTKSIFERIDTLLEKVGADHTQLLTASIWLTDMADFEEFNTLWQQWLEGAPLPARATVGAPLALPGLKIEIQVSAVAGALKD